MHDRINQQFVLKNGPKLGFAEFGDPNGKPVFFFHGNPQSRLSAEWIHMQAEKLEIRLVATDLPGIGLSDPQPDYRLLDWPNMIQELADGLNLNKFGVMGHSGGGPFALACGYRLPERLSCISMVCGAGPLHPETMVGISKQMSEDIAFAVKNPEKYSETYLSSMGSISFNDRIQWAKNNWIEPDRKLLTPAAIEMWRKSDFETFRQGPGGTLKHWFVCLQSYEFELQQIKAPTIIWQGELDDVIPPAMAKYMARSIPGSELHLIPGEGHNSLIVNYAEAILSNMKIRL